MNSNGIHDLLVGGLKDYYVEIGRGQGIVRPIFSYPVPGKPGARSFTFKQSD